MEVQDTVMEARGPSNVNTVDTAASQPRYSLRSTDKVSRRESSVTKVDPHHCAIAETETQHSSPPQPRRSPDLTNEQNFKRVFPKQQTAELLSSSTQPFNY